MPFPLIQLRIIRAKFSKAIMFYLIATVRQWVVFLFAMASKVILYVYGVRCYFPLAYPVHCHFDTYEFSLKD